MEALGAMHFDEGRLISTEATVEVLIQSVVGKGAARHLRGASAASLGPR